MTVIDYFPRRSGFLGEFLYPPDALDDPGPIFPRTTVRRFRLRSRLLRMVLAQEVGT